jgi:hypothetical protein
MAGKVVITVEYKDPHKPSKSISCDVEEAIGGMRDLCFRVAVGEYEAVYMTGEKPLNLRKEQA